MIPAPTQHSPPISHDPEIGISASHLTWAATRSRRNFFGADELSILEIAGEARQYASDWLCRLLVLDPCKISARDVMQPIYIIEPFARLASSSRTSRNTRAHDTQGEYRFIEEGVVHGQTGCDNAVFHPEDFRRMTYFGLFYFY
jgi:hypothetical protein